MSSPHCSDASGEDDADVEEEDEEQAHPPPQLCFALHRIRIKKSGLAAAAAKVPCSSSSSVDLAPTASSSRWRCFRYQEIALATNCFHSRNLVGSGGYGRVYRGTLPSGVPIAVKVLKGGRGNKERDFLTEVGVLGHISHPNTTRLLGFCIGQGRYLIFECSLHGSLATQLHGSTMLGWAQRYKVACSAARGLHYLHKQCPRRIIHRDIKSSNILLGADFEAQISDFGLARWLPHEWTHHTIKPLEGTVGYMAPEYVLHGIVDEKTDVYAFGVVLLELITGCKPVEGHHHNLVDKVQPLLESGKLERLADKRLEGAFNAREMQRLSIAATLCLRRSSISRPDMRQVVELLRAV